ncbi:hypothetical protein P5V15_003703 [Pogonomyrmex californicus]
MRNLSIYQRYHKSFDFMKNVNRKELMDALCIINANDAYILLNKYIYVLPSGNDDFTCAFVGEFDNSEIVSLDYCNTLHELFLAYKSGIIIKIDPLSKQDFNSIVLARFESGLQCMEFSPDHEIIAAVTGAGFVVTMILDCLVLSEVNLYLEEFGQNSFVTIGWGKKETQFHGSKGKAAAQAKPEELVPNETDDGSTQISWRGDGTLFVVSFLHKKTKIRQLKIFSREGVLLSTSEPLNGLEKNVAWNPSGSLIATTQRRDNRLVVAFIEKNGLKYSELCLPYESQKITIKDLLWSPCSEILTIVYHQPDVNSSLVELWTQNNDHWYLKQTLIFREDNPLIYTTWSSMENDINRKELIFVTKNEFSFYPVNWCVNHSWSKTADDKAVVGVIDGHNILVTGFRDGIVPPPLAHQILYIDEPVNAIVFAPNVKDENSLINSNAFCAILYTNELIFFKQEMENEGLMYKFLRTYSIDCDVICDIAYNSLKNQWYYLNHFLWFTSNIMLYSVTTAKQNLLCVLFLDKEINNRLEVSQIYTFDDPIQHIISSPDASTAYIITQNKVYKYTKDGQFEETKISFAMPCSQMEVIKIASNDVIIALSHDNNFFIDGEVVKNITGFYVHSHFLLLITLQATLICVPLSKTGIEQLKKHDLTIKPWLNLNHKEELHADIYIRRLERDSRIIIAVPQNSRTILQMPRGNLECIQPRILLLHILKSYLNSCDYLPAFELMTKQRINLNLIYDHNPQLFMDNIEKFVTDIAHRNINMLTMFLTELSDEDVTRTTYMYCYENHAVQSDIETKKTTINKVDKVCKILKAVMENRVDASEFMWPILITLVKNKKRQGLEDALRKIKDIKMFEDSQESLQCVSSVSASEILKYLLHFVNINTLYDVALGMYDFDLTMFIASKSSKDPKEYIPFLNDLKKLDKNYREYSINMHLKRYELAFKCLSKEPSRFEECLTLVREYDLYKIAMKTFEKNSMEYQKVVEIYGDFLSSKCKYSEAGMMYYRSGQFHKALEMFSTTGNDWQDAIALSKEMNLGPVDSYALYETLLEHLKNEKKYEHAATILKDYMKHNEEAIALLCEGKFWKQAIRIALDFQRLDLNETHIKPGVKEHAEYVIKKLDKKITDFLQYTSRLAIVRKEIGERRIYNEKICDDKESGCNEEIPDNIQDTLSTIYSNLSQRSKISAITKKSYRSSKNRRKHARKFFNLKEGSMFEDLSLIYALYQIVSDAYKEKDEWSELIKVLIYFKFDDEAEKIQVEMDKLLKLIESKKSEIWDRLAPTSLAYIDETFYTEAHLQEIIIPIKSVEQCLIYPPEVAATPDVTSIF